MGHNALDFARAAAVCRGWRAACRAAVATVNVYRETALQPAGDERPNSFQWSPCGKFVVVTISRPPRLSIWRASTGALVNEWALVTPATAVPPGILEDVEHYVIVSFSHDCTRVVTFFNSTETFAVWSVPDGQLVAVHRGDSPPDMRHYRSADIGVPGSASDGLVGFSSDDGSIDLWDVSPPPVGGASCPRLRSRVDLAPGMSFCGGSFAYSPDGSKFVATSRACAYVYDVASLTRLAVYTSPARHAIADWVADSLNVIVSWGDSLYRRGGSLCIWDFSRPGALPTVISASAGRYASFGGWSSSGASYFAIREWESDEDELTTLMFEERRVVDRSLVRSATQRAIVRDEGGPLVRAVDLRPAVDFPYVSVSPDEHALLLFPAGGDPARLVVFNHLIPSF